MSTGKPTAVHFSLIFFVMLSIIMAVLFWISKSDHAEARAQLTTQGENTRNFENANRQLLNEVNEIKKRFGTPDMPVGLDDDETDQTMLGALKKLLAEVGTDKSQGDQTLMSQVRKLRANYELANKTSLARQQEMNRKDAEIIGLNAAKKETIGKYEGQTQLAEDNLLKAVQNKDEELAAMSKTVDELKQEKEDLLTQVAQLQTTLRDATEDFQERIGRLTTRNNRLRQEQDELKDQTFERADGLVRFVDHSRKLVSLNLGAADELPLRTTFSVYTRDNHGVARRNKEDIKAKIEVTRIIGPHLAEARILEQDIRRPIAKGDPIYTPLFTVGVKEKFSFVGLIDLDGDGRSDRDLLHTIVASSGAEIDNEVLDDGSMTGDGLSVDTSFLVIGNVPTENTGIIKEDDAADLMRGHERALKESARELGIRWVALKDFMDYVGFKPRRRLFKPGDAYNLEAGLK